MQTDEKLPHSLSLALFDDPVTKAEMLDRMISVFIREWSRVPATSALYLDMDGRQRLELRLTV